MSKPKFPIIITIIGTGLIVMGTVFYVYMVQLQPERAPAELFFVYMGVAILAVNFILYMKHSIDFTSFIKDPVRYEQTRRRPSETGKTGNKEKDAAVNAKTHVIWGSDFISENGSMVHYDANRKKIGSSRLVSPTKFINLDPDDIKIGYSEAGSNGRWIHYDVNGKKIGYSERSMNGYIHHDTQGRVIGTQQGFGCGTRRTTGDTCFPVFCPESGRKRSLKK